MKKRVHPLFIRYIQSPLKSRFNVNDSKIRELIREIKVNQSNYIFVNSIRINSQYLYDTIPQIKRYLQNTIKKIALMVIRMYANSFHVNASSLIEDNNLFQVRAVDWLSVITKILDQLQKIHRYPNFKSLERSQYRDFIIFDFSLTKEPSSYTKYNKRHLLNKKIPLHIKIELFHIPLAKHARIRLAPLRKDHKHYMYSFSAVRGRWFRSNRNRPFGRYGAIVIRHIVYHDEEVANHMWIYGKENMKDIVSMPRGTHFRFQGWVAKYLKHHSRCYDYRINHIRNVRLIKKK